MGLDDAAGTHLPRSDSRKSCAKCIRESPLCLLIYSLGANARASRTGLFASACKGISCQLVAAFDVDVYVSFGGRLERGRFVSVKKGRRIIIMAGVMKRIMLMMMMVVMMIRVIVLVN